MCIYVLVFAAKNRCGVHCLYSVIIVGLLVERCIESVVWCISVSVMLVNVCLRTGIVGVVVVIVVMCRYL